MAAEVLGASGSGLLPCGNARHSPGKRVRKCHGFCLHFEFDLENETRRFESVTESRRLEAAVIQPLPHGGHLFSDDFLIVLADTDFDRKHDTASPKTAQSARNRR